MFLIAIVRRDALYIGNGRAGSYIPSRSGAVCPESCGLTPAGPPDQPLMEPAAKTIPPTRVTWTPARCALLARGSAGFAMAVGCLVTLGWLLNIEALKRVVPGFVSMNPATAVAFCLAGFALWNIPRPGALGSRAGAVTRMLAAVVSLIGAGKLAALGFGWRTGVDEWLFPERLAVDGVHPNRMAPNTALAFIFVGLALALRDWKTRRGHQPAEWLALAAGFVAVIAMVGYIYSVPSLYGVASFIPMAMHTAFVFLVLALGILCARSESGWMALITDESPGSLLARRLFPAMLVVFTLLGWLRLAGERQGLYGAATGDTLYTVASIASFSLLIAWSAGRLHRSDRERRGLEASLRTRSAELEAANAELEAFSYSVSHDLRAPLRHIAGFADLLSRHMEATPDATSQRFLTTINRSVRRMNQLIDDLLSFARSGRTPLRPAAVNLGELVAEVRDALMPEFPNREVMWNIHPLPNVSADRALLRQVLVNLMGNALKYTGMKPEAKIEIGAQPAAAAEVTVYIRDNGAGFDMAQAHQLFGVFQRLHSEQEFEGTGIGLANVRRIIHRQGGRTWAEGEPGLGATFYFSLPNLNGNGSL